MKVTRLRSATDMLVPITLRSSSASAVRRDTRSPLRLRSWKPASSWIRCEYNFPRRSATTRSASSDTKKKRAAVASASATAATNSHTNARSIAPPPPCAKPWSIMVRNAIGRLSVALLDAPSAISQATNKPRCLRTNGHRVRRLPILRDALSALTGAISTLGSVRVCGI